jgi:hypothetical protein
MDTEFRSESLLGGDHNGYVVDSSPSAQGPAKCFCEDDNEHSGSYKVHNFLTN